jgi:hypothetical protein
VVVVAVLVRLHRRPLHPAAVPGPHLRSSATDAWKLELG